MIKGHDHKVMFLGKKVYYVSRSVKAELYQWVGFPVSQKINELVKSSRKSKRSYLGRRLTWTVCICGDWITDGCGVWITPWTWTVWPEGNCTRVTAGEPLPVLDPATETCKNQHHWGLRMNIFSAPPLLQSAFFPCFWDLTSKPGHSASGDGYCAGTAILWCDRYQRTHASHFQSPCFSG